MRTSDDTAPRDVGEARAMEEERQTDLLVTLQALVNLSAVDLFSTKRSG